MFSGGNADDCGLESTGLIVEAKIDDGRLDLDVDNVNDVDDIDDIDDIDDVGEEAPLCFCVSVNTFCVVVKAFAVVARNIRQSVTASFII